MDEIAKAIFAGVLLSEGATIENITVAEQNGLLRSLRVLSLPSRSEFPTANEFVCLAHF